MLNVFTLFTILLTLSAAVIMVTTFVHNAQWSVVSPCLIFVKFVYLLLSKIYHYLGYFVTKFYLVVILHLHLLTLFSGKEINGRPVG